MSGINNMAELKLVIEKIEEIGGDRVITRKEIEAILKTENLKNKILYFAIFNSIESNENGDISVRDFIKLAQGSSNEKELLRSICMNIIKSWDRNGDGRLDINEFRKFIQIFDENFKYNFFDGELQVAFDEIDKNGDATISLEELEDYFEKTSQLEKAHEKQRELEKVEAKRKFEECDLDRDGLLNYEEYKNFDTSGFSGDGGEFYRAVFDDIDKNKDGKISYIDYENYVEDIYRALSDSCLGCEELLAESMIKSLCKEIFEKSDTNKDGLISFDEYKQMCAKEEISENEIKDEFDSIDLDRDGQLSFEGSPMLALFRVVIG